VYFPFYFSKYGEALHNYLMEACHSGR
jgi:hypothetical protein